MAISVDVAYIEGQAQEVANAGGREVLYRITGTSDREAAIAAFLEQVPTELAGLVVNGISVERTSDNTFDGIAQYGMIDVIGVGREPGLKEGDDEFSMDTTGGMKKILFYRSPPREYGRSTKKPRLKGAINVDPKDKTVEGAEIGTASCKFTITRILSNAQVPSAFLNKLYLQTYTVNSATCTLNVQGKVLEFEPGELLFMGANITYSRAAKNWRIVGSFSAQPNESNLTIGDITGIDVKGWEYVSAYFTLTADTSQSVPYVVPKPVCIYVGEVYRTSDINELGF